MSKKSRMALRWILLPLTGLYGLAIYIRNLLYTYNIKKSYTSKATVISVGNIAVGGTGKTPCIAYLLHLLQHDFHTAVVSRGYNRQTKGYRLANDLDNAYTIGDEPYQLYKHIANHNTCIVVGEDRATTIKKLMLHHPDTEVILLDDGYQHRKVERKLNILLTTFQQPFFTDYLLPAGKLREYRQAARRADIILVTKCPLSLSEERRGYFQQQISKYQTHPKAAIFFTYISYAQPLPLWPTASYSFEKNIILLTGIADPNPLVEYVSKKYNLVQHIAFKDHHWFSQHDIEKIVWHFHQVTYEKKCILTTEKDSVRLMDPSLAATLKQVPIFWLPMQIKFAAEEEKFKQIIFHNIRN